MNKLDEATDNLYLNAGQDIEEQLPRLPEARPIAVAASRALSSVLRGMV